MIFMYKHKYHKYKTKYLQIKLMYQKGGGYYFDRITNKEEVLRLDPKMTGEIFDKFPETTYYFYYYDNDTGNSDMIGYLAIQKSISGIHPVLKKSMDGYMYIWAVEILEQHRGKGMGSKMLTEILSDKKKYILQVEKDNKIAIKLYKKLGFKIKKKVKKIDSSGNTVLKYIMTRPKIKDMSSKEQKDKQHI